jgi:glycosyltransferase involved in cell wall biosynthesis
MSQNPLVSVIVPAYNAEAHLADTLRSILDQTYRPIKVIVADDGSTDGTADVARSFGKDIVYVHHENRGPAGARNLGLKHVEGDYVAFLDADDLWHPKKLEIQVAFMEAHPDFVITGTNRVDFQDGAIPIWPELEPNQPHLLIPGETVIIWNRFTTSTVLTRTEAVRRAGEFDETIFGPEDWDIWRRILHNHCGGHLRTSLTAYRIVGGSVSSNPQRMFENNKKVIAKSYADNPHLSLRTRLRAGSNLHLDAALMFMESESWRPLREILISFALWPFRIRPNQPRHIRLKIATNMALRLMGLRSRPTKKRPNQEEVSP